MPIQRKYARASQGGHLGVPLTLEPSRGAKGGR